LAQVNIYSHNTTFFVWAKKGLTRERRKKKELSLAP